MLWALCRGGLWALESTRKSWSCLPLWPPEIWGTFVLNIGDIRILINPLQIFFQVDVSLPRAHSSRFLSFDTSICPELTLTSTVPIWSLLKTHTCRHQSAHIWPCFVQIIVFITWLIINIFKMLNLSFEASDNSPSKVSLHVLWLVCLCCLPVKEWQVSFTVLKTVFYALVKFKGYCHKQLILFFLQGIWSKDGWNWNLVKSHRSHYNIANCAGCKCGCDSYLRRVAAKSKRLQRRGEREFVRARKSWAIIIVYTVWRQNTGVHRGDAWMDENVL